MINTNLIEVDTITNIEGGVMISKKISLTLQKNEILGIIGPSGSGKTTIIKSIMGMETPKEGTVHVLGKEIPNREIMAKIGYMGQSDALYELLSGRKNMAFSGSMMGLSKQNIIIRTKELAQLLG